MATSLTEGLQDALTFMLSRVALLRQCDAAWRFVLDTSPLDNARMLFCATPHHLTGRTESKVTCMPVSSSGQYAAEAALYACEESGAAVNTCWYSVPYRSYDSISVGVLISENEDTLDLLSLNHCFRHSRYARNDTNGEYFTLHIDEGRTFVECYCLAPISMTERKRALIRFDYAPFMAATRNRALPISLSVAKLLNSVRSCHIVSEYRWCPLCTRDTRCQCELRFHAPRGPYDLERNTLNMLDQAGEYVGFSYHFDRDNNVLDKFFNKCCIIGGIGGDMDKSKRLVTMAIQRYLKDLPIEPQNGINTGYSNGSSNNNCFLENNSHPSVQSSEQSSTQHKGTSIQTDPIAYATSSEVSEICISAPASVCFSDPPAININEITPGNTIEVAMPSPLTNPPVISSSNTITAGTRGVSKQSSAISKSPPKRRGRRPRKPVEKPLQPVLIAPAANAVTGVAGPSNGTGGMYGEFKTQEEYKNHLKKLRSRMSAARANERRKEKRKREQQRRKLLMQQATGDDAASRS